MNQHGAVAILVGISMLALVGFTALAVDVGYVMTTRNELQNIADAAALATARQLGDIYKVNSTYDNSIDLPIIVSVAKDVALENRAGGKIGIHINASDVEIGVWDGSAFTPSAAQPNATRATARRDGGANGPLSTFFAKILGIDSVNVNAQAIAALSAQATAEDVLPFGISKTLFETAFCDQPESVYFTEDLQDCAGWHTFEEWPENSEARLEDIVSGMNDGTFENPGAKVGDEFVFTGWPVLSVFNELQVLYNSNKDADGNWEVNIAVYDNGELNGCGTPSPWPNSQTARSIVGFATFMIEDVFQNPDYFNVETIKGKIICETAEDGRGIGIFLDDALYFGTLGSLPSLVK
jgi:hypothetical protein